MPARDDPLRSSPAGRRDDPISTRPAQGWPDRGVTIRSSVLEAVLDAQGLGLLAAGGRLVREAGGGGLAQQGSDDAPNARQLVATGGAGPLTVGAVRRRSALTVLLVLSLLALVLALAGASLLGPGALAALLVRLRAPLLAAATLAGAGTLAGAVGGLLAGPGAVDALATRVVGCSKALPQLGQVRQMVAVIAPPPPRSAAARSRER
jgi:hypothetical protein